MALIEVKSVTSGSVWKLETEVGAKVEEDDELLILESMKMEIPILATTSGIIKEITVGEGEVISEGDVAVIIEE